MPLPDRPHCWQLRNQELVLSDLPRLMGIVNVTPDSFSDGGQFMDSGRAVERAMMLVGQGADIIDIGGESTRPYSHAVSVKEQLRRVLPVIRTLSRQTTVPISIDSCSSIVAQAALDEGVQIINDVTGLQGDPLMLDVAVRSRAGICVMHMQGSPATMQDNPVYDDVVADVYQYLQRRRDALLDAGIEADRICLDPGIGFGKTHQHNVALLRNCARFLELGCPVLVGHSRKGFIGHILGDRRADRLAGTIGVAIALAIARTSVLRIHDIGPVRQALDLFAATCPNLGRPT